LKSGIKPIFTGTLWKSITNVLIGTVDTYKIKIKRFFTWAGKSDIVNHLNT